MRKTRSKLMMKLMMKNKKSLHLRINLEEKDKTRIRAGMLRCSINQKRKIQRRKESKSLRTYGKVRLPIKKIRKSRKKIKSWLN